MTLRARDPQAGLTLIEMMIVLVIIGIASSAAVIGTQVLARDTAAEDEARRLAARLSLAVDEAMVTDAPLALRITDGAYSFHRWTASGWQVAATPLLAQAHALPGRVTLTRPDGQTGDVMFLPDALGGPDRLQLTTEESAWLVVYDGLSATSEPAP